MNARLEVPVQLEERLRQMFAEQAAQPALLGDEPLTYAQLGARLMAIVGQLRAAGLAPGARVGLCIGRSNDLLGAVLACLHEGLCFVPLEPAFPAERLRGIAADAQLARVLCSPEHAGEWSTLGLVLAPGRAGTPDWPVHDPQLPAYMMFTSGSTGRPKGVVIARRALASFLCAACRRLALDGRTRWLFITTPAFDISLLEMLGPLWAGGALQTVAAPTHKDPDALRALLDASPGINHVQATPAFWRMLLKAGWAGNRELVALCGGEALDAVLAERLAARVARLWNCYGPTETTVWSLMAPVELPLAAQGVLLRQSLPGYRHWVLDDDAEAVAVGSEGELCIEGPSLAEGYWQRPELTAVAFIDWQGRRLYRTGDRVRLLAGDCYRYLGRRDDQVKLRGFRIELGEVEAQLRAIDGVQDAAVCLLGEGDEAALVAWVEKGERAPATRMAIRRALQRRLPQYMVPGRIHFIEALPKSASGKIDRKRLVEDEGRSALPIS